MQDGGDQLPLNTIPPLDRNDHLLLTTSIAAILVAASAFFCGSRFINRRHAALASDITSRALDSATTKHDSTSPHSTLQNNASSNPPLTTSENGPASENVGNARDSAKNSRSKERRRRGKDPVKELLKSGKKINNLTSGSTTKSPATALETLPYKQEEPSGRSASHSPLPLIQESLLEHQAEDLSQHQQEEQRQRRNPSADSSTRSASRGAALSLSSATSEWQVVGHRSPKSTSNSTPHDTIYSGTPSAHTISEADSMSVRDDIELPTSDSHSELFPQEEPAVPGPTDVSSLDYPPPPARATSSSTTITPSPKKPTLKSQPSTSKLADDPWEWDGQSHPLLAASSPTTTNNAPLPKLQKKRSALTVPPVVPVSKPGPSAMGSGSGSAASTSTLMSEAEIPMFPTLNNAVSQPVPQGRKRPLTPLSDNHPVTSNSPRRAPTPRGAPTPSTPPPSVSMHTQLASMKGALEAARLREDKMRTEVERMSKELDVARWDNMNLRRREGELQAQLRHFHQFQSYALFASVSQPSPGASQPQHPNPNHPNHTSSPSSSASSPSTSHPHQPQPQPLQLHMLPSTLSSLMSPGSILSPVNINSPHPPQFYYPPPPPPPPSQQPSFHSPYVFSMHYPGVGTVATNGSEGSGNGSGTGSGSGSPDVSGGSSSPVDRGRRRTREWEDVVGGSAREDEYDAGEDSGSEVNEMLADAILKRPGSIRIKSKGSRRRLADLGFGEGEGEEGRANGVSERGSERVDEMTEFTFPSISDLGNVRAGKRPAVRAEEDVTSYFAGEVGAATMEGLDNPLLGQEETDLVPTTTTEVEVTLPPVEDTTPPAVPLATDTVPNVDVEA